MYSYCDQNVFNTSRGDRLLLWATRAWACAVVNDACPFRLLLPIFCRMGLVASTLNFHKSMCCLNLGGVDIAPLAHPRDDAIDEQEAVLLALWNSVRSNQQECAIRTLEHLLDPEYVTDSLAAMSATMMEAVAERPDLFQPRNERPWHSGTRHPLFRRRY